MADRPAGLAAGDRDRTFRELSARHVQSAYRLAWAILGDDCDAEDATQDAFMSAWRQRATLRDAVPAMPVPFRATLPTRAGRTSAMLGQPR